MNRFQRNSLAGYFSGLILVAVVFLAACNGDKYQKAAQASKDFALANQGFQNLVIAAKQQHLISVDENNRLEKLAGQLASIGLHVDSAVRNAAAGQSVATDIDAAITEAQALDNENLDWVKNPQSKAELQLGLAGARSILTTIKLIINK